MDIISDKKVRANKIHICSLCRRHICIGETYRYQFINNGDIYECRTHLGCFDLISLLNMQDYFGEGITPDVFMEYVWDYYKRECTTYVKGRGKWVEARDFTLNSFGLYTEEGRV